MAGKLLRLFIIKSERIIKDLGPLEIAKMGDRLVSYFKQCIHSTKFSSVDYFTEAMKSKVTDDDLLCYLVYDEGDSIIKKKYPAKQLDIKGGNSVWCQEAQAVISEVYLSTVLGDPEPGYLCANLIFHEYAHNRLQSFPHPIRDDIHKIPHVLLLSKVGLRSDWTPVAADITWMRRGLHHPRAQYTGDLAW